MSLSRLDSFSFAGGARALTPSKSDNLPRSVTPNVERASSASKILRATQEHSHDAKKSSKASFRSQSARKQRRWENKNLFTLRQFLDVRGRDTGNQEDAEYDIHAPIQFDIEWKSNLAKLFEASNHEMLERFRSGYTTNHMVKQPSTTLSCRQRRKDEWQAAEFAFFNMEKKIRNVITKGLNDQAHVIMEEMENLLIAVGHSNDLECKLNLQSIPGSTIVRDKDKNLIFELQQPYHRLLLHGVCQFYSIKSKSIISKSGKTGMTSNKRKLTVVYLPNPDIETSIATPSGYDLFYTRVSFSHYLKEAVWHLNDEDGTQNKILTTEPDSIQPKNIPHESSYVFL